MREGKKWILTNQKIDSENILYEWVSEPGACKVCQEMDGKVYESANDIPDRPHPNCKCHIELIEKEREITDPIEIYQEQRREKQRVILEIQKAQGDILSMTEEIDEFLKQVDDEETKLTQLKSLIDINNLEKDEFEKLNKAFEQVEFARYRGEKVKKELNNLHSQAVVLEGSVEKVRILGPLFEKILKEAGEILGTITGSIARLAGLIKELTIEALKELKKIIKAIENWKILFLGANTLGRLQGNNEAANLLTFSLTKGTINPIFVNAKLYQNVSDLHNYKLEIFIRSKLLEQIGTNEARGFVFNSESKIAQKITESESFKNYFREKNRIPILSENRILENGSFRFTSGDTLYALGNVNIIDVHLDNNDNLLAKIIDTYDFNKDDPSWLVQMARTVQDVKLLENFFEIIEIKVPPETWKQYIKK